MNRNDPPGRDGRDGRTPIESSDSIEQVESIRSVGAGAVRVLTGAPPAVLDRRVLRAVRAGGSER